jgi:hypothetical protein
LVKEGFVVLPYTTDDLINARKLIDAGAAAVVPLGAPIGSGLGIQNQTNLQILREQITSVPLIVDAGVGTASDPQLRWSWDLTQSFSTQQTQPPKTASPWPAPWSRCNREENGFRS